MHNAIKHQHDVFGAYGQLNDWGFEEPKPTVEIFVNNGRTSSSYATLSLEEAAQAIEILKAAIKEAEKQIKKSEKHRAKRQRF